VAGAVGAATAAQTAAVYANAGAPLLTVANVSVRFGPVRALDGVDLTVRSGELVALAGENGAGKTTLVRCIAGDVAPATGEIQLAGRRVHAEPASADKHGIAVVWQDLALCDNLDIAANVLLGQERKSRRKMRRIRCSRTSTRRPGRPRRPVATTKPSARPPRW
jgi:D-xylose transport system ATP-binding protein